MRRWIVLLAVFLVVILSGLAQALTFSEDAQLNIIKEGSYWTQLHYQIGENDIAVYSGRFHTLLTQGGKTIDTYSYCIDPGQVFYWNDGFGVDLNPAENDFAAAAWLVYNFDPFNGVNKREGSNLDVIAALQLAVWTSVTTGFNYTSNGDEIDGLYYKMIELLNTTDDYSGAQEVYVAALNGERQDQLVAAPVPEPATMLLMGIGLLGLGVVGRKRLK